MNANNLHTYRCPKFHVFYLIPMHFRLSLLSEQEFVIQLESQLKNRVGYSLLDKPRCLSFCVSQFSGKRSVKSVSNTQRRAKMGES